MENSGAKRFGETGVSRVVMKERQAGFTLIELVIVVTIVSFLAAVAIPKYVELQADARVAKMRTALGSVKAAAAMAHALLVARGLERNFTGTPVPAIEVEGTVVSYINGYPDAASVVALAGLAAPDYVIDGLSATAVAAPDNGHSGVDGKPNCTIAYTPAMPNRQPVYGLHADSESCR